MKIQKPIKPGRLRVRRIAPLLIVMMLVSAAGVYRLSISQAASLDSQATSSDTATFSPPPQIEQEISGDQRYASDPPVSLTPNKEMRQACFVMRPLVACDGHALQAINAARAQEGLGAITLPSNYLSMTIPEQIVAITNAERIDRALPAFKGPDKQLNEMALQGALAKGHPKGPDGYNWGGNWAGNIVNPLSAHYLWMYDDGLNSTNRNCSAEGDIGCWGHRHNILSPWGGSMGASETLVNGYPSMTQIFVKNWP